MDEDTWEPHEYDDVIATIPGYADLQAAVIRALDPSASRVLELGVGTGETTRRILDALPDAALIGIDGSAAMLDAARASLPADCVDLRHARIEAELPAGPFDAVVSVLAIHHLTDDDKRDLFRRVHAVLRPGGQFVVGDVVVPRDPRRALVELEDGVDLPAPAAAQVDWLRAARFRASIAHERDDLAVLVAVR